MKQESISGFLKNEISTGILNSYSIIFFLDNKLLAGILLLVSFLNFWAGLSGFLAVLFVLLVGHSMSLDKAALRSGVYSFNALLVGVGMGTFFDPSIVFFSLLALAALLTLMLSVGLNGWLSRYKLPHLSIPFVVSFWFVVLPASHFENLGLTQRSIFWMNEMYAVGGNHLLQIFQSIDNFQLNKLVDIYLRSISSIFFQNNIIAGLLVAIALLISSRIMFSLSMIGFLSAYFFARFTGSETASINYYNIGANYMMVAFAIGGYFTIPSKQSYLWTILLIPLTSLVLLFFYKLLGYIQLPVFSLPFSFVTILFIYFLQFRTKAKSLVITPLQLNSPEKNLYAYKNNLERLSGLYYFPLHFPFMGEWKVTQSHEGEYTHKGEWRHAYDFMITDHNDKTYRNGGYDLSDYFCYNKPVFAPADGFVEVITDTVEDNEPGKINTVNNWGNSIVIRHINGLYSQISHLKKGTFKVHQGDFVRKGDLLARCGNSGRSPQPHIHFQMQILPVVGAKTIDYPFAYYYVLEGKTRKLMQYQKPVKDETVMPVSQDAFIFNAFNLLPDNTLEMEYTINSTEQKTGKWDTYTDAYNQKYIHCAETNSFAYYVNDGYMFYFTAFYGDKKSLLYYFYLSAYKIYLGGNQTEIKDELPLHVQKSMTFIKWMQDFAAPFYKFISILYVSNVEFTDNALDSGTMTFRTSVDCLLFHRKIKLSQSTVTLSREGITEFKYMKEQFSIQAKCTNINT